jgi:hypothetical protein
VRDELTTQNMGPAPRFVMVTTAGVMEVEKMRPVDVLAQVEGQGCVVCVAVAVCGVWLWLWLWLWLCRGRLLYECAASMLPLQCPILLPGLSAVKLVCCHCHCP